MATLGQVEQATLTANSDIESKTSTTAGTLSGLDTAGGASISQSQANAGGLFGFGSSNYDFVGIAGATGVEEMTNAIKTYCDAVNAKLDEMVVTANPEGTFAGKYTAEINAFLKSIQDSCKSNVTELIKFQQDLNNVYAAMQRQDTNVAGSFADDTSSINANVTNGSN